jgi:hypothetical protein
MSSTSVFGPVGLYDTARPVIVIDPDPSQPALLLAAGTTVQTTGALADLGGGAWVEIDAPDSPRRFIRYDDLVPTPGIAPDVAAVPCDGGDEPASFPTPTAEPPPASGGGAQTYVFGVDHQVLADGCERVTIVFGGDGLDGRAPIGEIPGGVSFTARGSNGSVYLPFVELQDPVVTLQTGRAGDRAALFTVVRLAEPAGSGEQAAVIHSNAVRRMEATFMENPARVVIDLGEESSAPGGDLAPAIGPERSPTEPGEPFAVITQLQGSGDDLAFRGLARTFEAVADIRLRTAGMVPGGGTPVTATFTGVIGGTVTDDSVAVSLTDYVLAWGEFEIGIEGLAAGTYELFVGEPDMETGLDEGAYLTFEVE